MNKLQLTKEELRPLSITALSTAKEGVTLKVLGETKKDVKLFIGSCPKPFYLRPVVIKGLAMDVNLSLPFLTANKIDQLHSRGALLVRGREVCLRDHRGRPTESGRSPISHSFVYTSAAVKVPAYSWGEFPLTVAAVAEGKMMQKEGLLVGDDRFMHRTGLHPVRRRITGCTAEGLTAGAVLNMTDQEVTIPKGTRYGIYALRSEEEEISNTNHEEIKPHTDEEKDQWLIKEFRLRKSPFLQNPKNMEAALATLKKHWGVFSLDGAFGKTSLIEHHIETGTHNPINMRYRPINPALESNLKEQLEEWLKHDVIEESNSPWSFALVAVKKKNGKIRWCIDYRRLNSITKRDTFPAPLIQDNLARLADSTIFSGLDGMGAFHVVPLTKSSRPKTAFSTPFGTYHFKRMPFGLSNGPATYSRLMQMALQGIPTSIAMPYLDDTIIHSDTFTNHLRNLDLVLAAHVKAGLKLQPEKCQLFQEEIEYLGHLVSKKGISPVPSYVQIVKEWPLPQTLTEIRSFLGKVGYYARFIADYAQKAKPWTDAVAAAEKDKKNAPLIITPAMKKSFEVLKDALTTAPVLSYPHFTDEAGPFVLDTDWSESNGTIGAVLSQVQNEEEKVIAYAARKLTKSQSNYPAIKGELAAVIYFMKYFRYYLQFKRFILRTDHRALTWIKTMEHPTGMIQRWLETLSTFNFVVQHRQGKHHLNADALSRVEHAPEMEEEEEEAALLNFVRAAREEEDEILTVNAITQIRREAKLPSTVPEWTREQKRDAGLLEVMEWLSSGQEPATEERKQMSPYLRHYAERFQSLFIDEEGLLRYHDPLVEGDAAGVLCVPAHLQADVVWAAHQLAAHRGVDGTMDKLTLSCHFPGMRKITRECTNGCLACQQKGDRKRDQRHTYATILDGYPFQRLCLDFVGPLPPSKNGNKYLLTIMDAQTRWIEAFPIRAATAEKVVDCLEKEIFSRYAYPETLHSDQGAQFTGRLLREVGDLLDIVVTHTPAYNPKSNRVERFHRDLKAALRGIQAEKKVDWEEALPAILFATRTTVNRQTGFSPYQIMFARDPHIPLAVIEAPPAAKESEVPLLDYMKRHRHKMEAVQELTREHLQQSVHRQRRYYRDKLHTYYEGQKVWLFTPPSGEGVSRKLHRGYTGPWTIKSRINLTTYELEPADGWTWRASLVVSCDRLKPYFTPAERLSLYEPDPDLDPADYECRGNENLETLDRALPAPPSHRGRRGRQRAEEEDEEEEEQPSGRGGALQGPRPRRGHPPGLRGRLGGLPRPTREGPMPQLPRPCRPRDRGPETPRQVPVPEPADDLEWDRYDLHQARLIPSPVPRGAARVAEARRQRAQQDRLRVIQKRATIAKTPNLDYSFTEEQDTPLEEEDVPWDAASEEDDENETFVPLAQRRLATSPGFQWATAETGARPRRQAAMRGEERRRAAS